MSKVYVLLKKVQSRGITVPGYQILPEPPIELGFSQKLAVLEPGEYIEVCKCEISEDFHELLINSYKVINQDGQAVEEFVESYIFAREF